MQARWPFHIMLKRNDTILAEYFIEAMLDFNEAMNWSAILCPPKTSK